MLSVIPVNYSQKKLVKPKNCSFGKFAGNKTTFYRETAKVLPGVVVGCFDPKMGVVVATIGKVASDFVGFCVYHYKKQENIPALISKLNISKRLNDKTEWLAKNQPSKAKRMADFLNSYN